MPTRGSRFIDRDNGGSGIAYGETLGKAAKGIKNVDTVIPGHSAGDEVAGLRGLRRVQPAVPGARARLAQGGKTPEQAMMDFKLPEKFKDYYLTGGRGGPGGNFGVLFEELKKQP